jgi:hypothetical protein
MRITLELSESLLSIYNESGQALQESIVIESDIPLTIGHILAKAGINPLLAPMIVIDDVLRQKEHIVESDSVITLIGPLAGG